MKFRFAVPLLLGIALASPTHAQSVEEFYRGKRIEIRVGTGPGGGYDLAARLLARYLGKYMPGNPTAIVQNVPGAASLALMNQLYNVAPSDGTVLGVVTNGIPTAPLLTPDAVRFDLTRFQWIGSPAPETQIVMVWHKARAQTLADLFTHRDHRRRDRSRAPRPTTCRWSPIRSSAPSSRSSAATPAPRRSTSRWSAAKSRAMPRSAGSAPRPAIRNGSRKAR